MGTVKKSLGKENQIIATCVLCKRGRYDLPIQKASSNRGIQRKGERMCQKSKTRDSADRVRNYSTKLPGNGQQRGRGKRGVGKLKKVREEGI